MRKVELLAPAGNMESLQAAVAAGADAVYMGAGAFGARAEAGFSAEDVQKAIDYAHLYGRRVHITVNTLCKQHELPAVRELLSFLRDAGADAVLIQDLGILRMALTEFPELTVHASTQMTIHQPSGVKWLKEIGVSRAVLARECSLDTIRECSRAQLETEVFVHGALCVSVSGQCGLSSWIGPRSGNRGRCAQPCRMKYEYKGQQGCWLSPADLCEMNNLPELLDAGVSSLKIEGRLKRPEYVYTVTSLYRQALAEIAAGAFLPDRSDVQEQLTQIFSRGQFTSGYPAGQEDRGIMYPAYAGARGILLGKTTGRVQQAKGVYLTEVRLLKPLQNGDGLHINDQTAVYSGPDVPSGCATLRLREKVEKQTEVWRTESEEQLSYARSRYESSAFQREHPLFVDASLTALLGQPLLLTLVHEGISATITDDPPEPAQVKALTEASARRSLSKMGGTPFALAGLTLQTDRVFLPDSRLNALRKKGLEALRKAVIEARRPSAPIRTVPPFDVHASPSLPPVRLAVSVSDPAQIPDLCEAGAELLFLEPADWREGPLTDCLNLAEQALRSTGGRQTLVLQLPTVCADITLDVLRRLNERFRLPLSLGSVGQLGLHLPNLVFAGPGVPVTNSMSERFLRAQGIQSVTLSRELSLSDIRSLDTPDVGRLMPVYGRPRLMLLTHCPERTFLGLSQGKASCELCEKGRGTAGQSLRDFKGLDYPLIPQRFPEGCRVGLYAAVPTSIAGKWASMNLRSVSPLLQFTTETMKERASIVRCWRNLLDGKAVGPYPSGTLDRLTDGVL